MIIKAIKEYVRPLLASQTSVTIRNSGQKHKIPGMGFYELSTFQIAGLLAAVTGVIEKRITACRDSDSGVMGKCHLFSNRRLD